MLGFLIGLFTGAALGTGTMCILFVARSEDRKFDIDDYDG